MYEEDSIIISPIIFITFDLINNLYFCTFHICVCKMKHLLNKTLLSSGAIASLLLSVSLVSCQDEDYGFTSEEIRAAAYDRNFIAKYGEIDPEQSWDLSKYAVGNNDAPSTRSSALNTSCSFDADENSWLKKQIVVEDEWYYVDGSLISAFNHELGEGVNNESKGHSFDLTSTGSPFYIIPLFQGVSGLECDLHMVVDYNGKRYDKQIWDKCLNLEKQDRGSYDWVPIGQRIDFWNDYGNDDGTLKNEYEAQYKGGTYGAEATRSKPIKCTIPKDATIQFYLHITKGHVKCGKGTEHDWWSLSGTNSNTEPTWEEANLSFTGVKQWSSNGKMIALTGSSFKVSKETQDKFGKTAMIIGCEDALYGTEDALVYSNNSDYTTYKVNDKYTDRWGNKRSISKWAGDNDMNDLVFMFISDDLPSLNNTDEIQKRYLVEDLGSVVDWDFNDIVVDLYQKTKNGEIVEQKAVLRHKCGTTPFEVNVGDALNVFGKQQGEIQAKGNIMSVEVDLATKKVNGVWPWDPDNNNITVKVYTGENPIRNDEGLADTSNSSSMHTGEDAISVAQYGMANFPKKGEIPRIIAVDTDFEWTEESHDIEKSMWTFHTISVNFDPTKGSVSGAGRYREGETVTLKVKANNGYDFISWDNGKGTEKEISFKVTGDMTLTPTFQSQSGQTSSWTVDSGTDQYNGKGFNNSDIGAYLDQGYNTINITFNNATESSEFGIRNLSNYWPKLLSTDPDRYKATFNNGSYVLTQEQIDYMKGNGFAIQKRSNDANFSIGSFTLSKTIDYYTVKLAVDGNGKITASDRSSENDAALPYEKACYPAGISAVLTAKETNNAVFSHWTDAQGNVVTNSTIEIKSDAKLIAHFVPRYTLTLRVADQDWENETKEDEVNRIKFHIYNSDGTFLETISPTNGVATKTFSNAQDVYVRASKAGEGPYDVKFVWTYNSNGTTYNTEDSRNDSKKKISVPENGQVVTVAVTYQVLAFKGLKYSNGTYTRNTDGKTADWGNTNVDGNGSQVFLHKGSTANFSATPKAGYRFVEWAQIDGQTGNFSYTKNVGYDPILRNITNENGTYFVTAVFEDAIEVYIEKSDQGYVKITNNDSKRTPKESEINSLMISKVGTTDVTLEAIAKQGYSFVTWGWSNINPTRKNIKIDGSQVNGRKEYFPTFAKVISTPGWGVQTGWDYAEFGKSSESVANWKKKLLSDNLSANNRTLVFYFDRDLPNNFELKMFKSGSTTEFTLAKIEAGQNLTDGKYTIRGNMAIVTLSQSDINTIIENGFYLRPTVGFAEGVNFKVQTFSVCSKNDLVP